MRPRVLYICGSLNQTSQLHAVSREMGDHDAWFTPYYGDWAVDRMRRMGLIEMTIGGNKRRGWCLDWLAGRGVKVDLDGERGGYDCVVTCTDLVVPTNARRSPVVAIQEGILDPESWISRVCRATPLPNWLAGTTCTGESGLYDRFCVASEGYRADFVRRGADPSRVVTTGIPNFDDCERYRDNAFPHRGYVLAATSDTRETLKALATPLASRRPQFIEKVVRIARAHGGRKILFKLHPNEDEARERALIERLAPGALVLQKGSAEEMIANCDVLVTQWSSVAFVGLALGKEVHSNFPREELARLCPLQNGARSAANIARVVRSLLGAEEPQREPLKASYSW
jgi:hypothetical protein